MASCSDNGCAAEHCSTCGAQAQAGSTTTPPSPAPRDGAPEAARLEQVHHQILVLSGKGGVGKSTVAVNLATALALAGQRVGLLDVDMHGPSVPRMLNLQGTRVLAEGKRMMPVEVGNLKVMSIGLLIDDGAAPLIWRGPMKMGVIKQFLEDVAWGELDFLVIDAPPGTGDEPLTVCQLLPQADGAVIVTTPQEVAIDAVRKSVTFCHRLHIPVLGIIENMSGLACPHCGGHVDVFGSGGGEALAEELGVRFLGRLPLEPAMVEAGDAGRPYIHHGRETSTGKIMQTIIAPLLEGEGGSEKESHVC